MSTLVTQRVSTSAAAILLLFLTSLLAGNGCQSVGHSGPVHPVGVAPAHSPLPCRAPARELSKVVLPTYVIEPPDVLMIDAVRIVPKQPYHLAPFDAISIQVEGTLPEAPIAGVVPVGPSGELNLGPRYPVINVNGMTVDQAKAAIQKQLDAILKEPKISVTLADTAAKQQISGQHLVGPDGTVTLGSYGSVSVVGMTLAEAKFAIEQHLGKSLEKPEISLEIFGFNSKVYYIVTQGAGMGDGVYRFPITGNETVLDAISQINGLQQVSSKKIWIARPTDEKGKIQNLPVKWEEITADAYACSNYQVLPGDRVFIAEDKLIALDSGLAKVIAPVERIMGFSLMGVGTVTRFSGPVLKGGGNSNGSF
jgi:polysaccharide export outer membrane protein